MAHFFRRLNEISRKKSMYFKKSTIVLKFILNHKNNRIIHVILNKILMVAFKK